MRYSILIICLWCCVFSTWSQGQILRPAPKPHTPAPQVKISEPDGYINGHGYVDLGLPSGIKWATCNVGASMPSEYGDYYAWGEIKTKSSYNTGNYFDNPHSYLTFIEYKQDGKTEITPSSGHDTVRENWGGSWRMPTASELDELRTKCTLEWTKMDGHNGYLVTGINGKSIFIPAAGHQDGEMLYYEGKKGEYWSSSLSNSLYKRDPYARCLIFRDHFRIIDEEIRWLGRSVRPVTE